MGNKEDFGFTLLLILVFVILSVIALPFNIGISQMLGFMAIVALVLGALGLTFRK